MGLPLRVAQSLRPLRRRPQRHDILRRVQRSARRVWVPALARLRHAAVPDVRPERAQRAEFRFVRAGVHQLEADDGRV
jgi:hypothetical protein